MRLVAAGAVDGAAIDSQVLAVATRDAPSLARSLRVVDALGPSTSQPVDCFETGAGGLRDEIQQGPDLLHEDALCASAWRVAWSGASCRRRFVLRRHPPDAGRL